MAQLHLRAELGIDGNCGFALIGANIQEGEAEFVEIPSAKQDANSSFVLPKGDDAAKLWACKEALRRLRTRLNAPNMSYYFGPSHPYGAYATSHRGAACGASGGLPGCASNGDTEDK